MALILGKRKRRKDVEEPSLSGDDLDEGEARALFQRAFEAKFNPLETPPLRQEVTRFSENNHQASDAGDASDWGGLSDADEDLVEIVDLNQHAAIGDDRQRLEKKAFMSSKPPSNSGSKTAKSHPAAKPDEEDSTEVANLKHDLALQRLLKESHLLSPATYNGTSDAVEGKSRLKALDLRLKALGAKQAISEQVKMPLAHRKGVIAKATNREVTRRKEAVENGVVLEKARAVVKHEQRRERGVGAPALGKFRGGMLKLSSRDVKTIEGPKRMAGGKVRRK